MSFPRFFLSLLDLELILSCNRQTFPHIKEHSQQHPQDYKEILYPGPSYQIPRVVLWPSMGPIPTLDTVTRGKGYHDGPKPLLFQEVRNANQNKEVKQGKHDGQAQNSNCYQLLFP